MGSTTISHFLLQIVHIQIKKMEEGRRYDKELFISFIFLKLKIEIESKLSKFGLTLRPKIQELKNICIKFRVIV